LAAATSVKEVEIYLIRHAIAEERGEEWPDDDLRPLTDEGMRRFEEVTAGLLEFEAPPVQIVTSPLVRARQTAQLLAAALHRPPPLTVVEELAPGYPPSTVLSKVRKLDDTGPIALVGHEPDLGHLAAHMIGASRPLPFKKGGMCRIDVVWGRPVRGTLIWFFPPKVLRRLRQRPKRK
jgi:phosphohistidine phosphatase